MHPNEIERERRLTESVRHMRELAAASARGPSEPAAPLGALGVARGSLPAVDAEALSQEWLGRSLKCAARAREAEKDGKETHAWCNDVRSQTYLLCADELRQRAGLPTSRQPEENNKAEL